jgi:hypothetical protein
MAISQVERHNHRAFSVSNVARTKRNLQRNLDIAQRKEYVPQVNKNLELEGAGADPPPYMVVVMGPMGCGKVRIELIVPPSCEFFTGCFPAILAVNAHSELGQVLHSPQHRSY